MDNQDPLTQALLSEQYKAELQAQMDFAFNMISKAGPEIWVDEVAFPEAKTRALLTNMISWFSSEEVEEYEKAHILQKGLHRLNKLS
jgi:hypothetical protein